jgi:methionine-rich copper-binding protein CopC
MRIQRLYVAILLAAALLVPSLALSHALPASAHAPLKGSNPSDLQVLTAAPAQLTLTFNGEIVQSPGTFAAVTCGGTDAVAGDEMPSASDPTTLVVPLMSGLPAGKCQVFWKSTASDDGGVTFGRFSFFIGNTSPADVAAAQPGASIAVPDDATQDALNPYGTTPPSSSQGSADSSMP